MEEMTSSAMEPPKACNSSDCLLCLIMNLDPAPIAIVLATTEEERIRVNFHDLMNPMVKAVTNVPIAFKISPSFSDIPS